MVVPSFLGLSLLACSPKSAAPVNPPPSEPSPFEALDAHLAELSAADRWQGSLAVTQAGKLAYAAAVGRTGPDPSPPINPDTRFRVGSITKTFAAVVAHQLVDEGKLAIDAPIADWFPDLPNAGAITIDHLLQHRSGLASFTNAPDYPTWSTQPTSRDALVERIASYPPVFEPDAKSAYSNSNYVLLGFVIEDVEGRSFAESVHARIAEPLELSRTSIGGLVDPSNNEAQSLSWTGAGWAVMPETHPSVPGAAGALVSTPTELCGFLHALFSGELVSAASLTHMRTMADGYGRGLFPMEFEDHQALGHGGRIDGFTANMRYFPDDATCVAISSHIEGSYDDLLLGAQALHFEQPWSAPEVRERVQLTAEQIEPYVGTYRSSTLPLVITLTRKDTVLWAQATGQPALVLDPVSATEFRFEPAELRMAFAPLEDGEMGFTLYQGGGEFLYARDAD